MLIGIGGVSRAGKSTLADLLTKQFLSQGQSVKTLRQDDYPVDEALLPMVRDRRDWEVPQSIDHEAFWTDTRIALKDCDIIIVEGLFCFYDRRLTEVMDKQLLVEITQPTFIKRKSIDLRWGSSPEPDWYIDHIWQQYLIHGLPNSAEGIYRVDGENYFNLIDILQHLEA